MERDLTIVQQNKDRFLDLITSVSIEGANIEGLVNWLTNKSDFFVAPASAHYHCHFLGGLCEHSLHVYDILKELVAKFASHQEANPEYVPATENTEAQGEEFITVPDFSEDTIKVVALLHDISKANFYEQYNRNVKNEITGKWEQVSDYRVIDEKDRFIYGNHEQTSEFMVRTFIPLTVEESVAILNHHGGMSWDSVKEDVSSVFNRYTLATLLHTADVLATFVIENE